MGLGYYNFGAGPSKHFNAAIDVKFNRSLSCPRGTVITTFTPDLTPTIFSMVMHVSTAVNIIAFAIQI